MPTQTKITQYTTTRKNKNYAYYKNKRYARKKKLNMARTINLRRQTHYFKRSFLDGTIVGNATYNPYLQGLSFQFQRLPNYTEFSSLFDRYMITYAKVYYHLRIDPSAQTASSATYPKIYFVKDYDDMSTPASLDELRQHSKCYYRVLNPNRPVVLRVKPATLAEVYRGLTTTTYSPKWNQWIDFANVDVPHYGYKIGIDDLTNTNYRVDVEVKLWFKCKDVR